jgi:hypothetical protein
MSSPAKRTAFRLELKRPRPAQPAGQRQRGDRPDPVDAGGEHPCAGQPPGRMHHLAVQRGELFIDSGKHAQRGTHLHLPDRGQPRGCGVQPLLRALAAQPSPLAGQPWRALVEEHRVDPLAPRSALHTQIVIGLQQRPTLEHLPRRDPALRQPSLAQQLAQMTRVAAVGLRVSLAAPQRRRIRRLGHMRHHPRTGQLLGDIPPAGAALHRELHLGSSGEPPREPLSQMLPVRRSDLAALQLTGDGVHIVERQLLSMDIQSSYDGHRDLLKLPKGHAPARPMRERLTQLIITRLS